MQLIDRNDELCVLYERSNQQKDYLRRGELALVKKEEEFRLLRLQTEELKWRYDVARKRIPELEANRLKIEDVEDKLKRERTRNEDLSMQLENPQNKDRSRYLHKGEGLSRLDSIL